MKPRTLFTLLVILAVSAVCVRLGFWQLARLHEKQALNARLKAALAQPTLALGDSIAPLAPLAGRRVEARGRFDESRQILLSGRAHDGAPGVEIVTPLVLASGEAVLVNRGWTSSADAMTARPQRWPEPGGRTVVGLLEPLARGAGGNSSLRLEADSVTLWSMRRLDADSLRALFPYPIAPYALRQLPGPGVPATPLRLEPRALGEAMHLSYAVQWFLFAGILLGGSAIFARRGRRAPGRDAPDAMPDVHAPR